MIRRARHAVACLLRTALVSLLIVPLLAGAQDKTSAKAFKPEELEQIVAPIAALPGRGDAQVLMASTYPIEVIEADRFAKDTRSSRGTPSTRRSRSRAGTTASNRWCRFLRPGHDERQARLDAKARRRVSRAAEGHDGRDPASAAKAQSAGNLKSNTQQMVIVEPAEPASSAPPASSQQQTVIKIEPAESAGGLRADLQPGGRLRPLALPGLSAVLLLPAGLRGRSRGDGRDLLRRRHGRRRGRQTMRAERPSPVGRTPSYDNFF
jgi:hypothetical protein